MPERKRSTRSGKASSGTSNNHFTTERSVGGERRSIRHYHDGRVSQHSTSASTVFNAKAVCKPKEPEYQPPTPAEIERLAGAVTNLFHPERTKPFDKPPLQIESPQSWSSDGSYGMITPPFPVASPTPEDSPELMSTEVFPLPVTVNPDTSDEDSNTISKQWGQMGGKNRGHSDIYN